MKYTMLTVPFIIANIYPREIIEEHPHRVIGELISEAIFVTVVDPLRNE